MRKVYVVVTTKLIINVNEGADISQVLAEMDYDFTSQTDGADIIDTDIQDWDVIDSK